MAKDEFGTNKEVLADKECDSYIETIVVRNKMVNVFMNDYGQCFWFQWVDDKGELQSASCGTYNTDYKEYIEDYFTPLNERLGEQYIHLRQDLRETQRDLDWVVDELKKLFPDNIWDRNELENKNKSE